jgi:hypothetical protein
MFSLTLAGDDVQFEFPTLRIKVFDERLSLVRT